MMGNEKHLNKKLLKVLSMLKRFSEYCSGFGIDIYDLKVVILGHKYLIPLKEKTIPKIAWYAGGLERKVTIKFKSTKGLKLGNGLVYDYNSYQIPLKRITPTVLKNSVKEEYKKEAAFIYEIKKWAKSNKVYFHLYCNKSSVQTEYDCAVLVSGQQISYGVGIGRKKDGKYIAENWIAYNTQEKHEFNSVGEIIKYLNKWINFPEVKEAKMSKVKAFAFKDRIVCASTRSQAVRVFASVNLLNDLSLKSQIDQEMMVLNALSNLRGANLEKVFTNIDIEKLKNLIEKYPEYEKKLPSRLRRLCKYNAIVTQD